MRRASSKDPDLADDLPLAEEAEPRSEPVKASSAPLLSQASAAFITFQDEETSQPCLASKEVIDVDAKTQSPSRMASSPTEQSTNTSPSPPCSTSPPDSQATIVDVPITAREASLLPAPALATPSEVPIENIERNAEETQPSTRTELICVSSSENEDEDLPLTDLALPTEGTKPQVDFVVDHSPRSAKACTNSASPAKKSVSWDVNDDRATYRQAKEVKQPVPPLPKQSTKKRSRQEYFAGEAEDYRPSDEEETSEEGSPESVKIRQESLDGFGSSPLTPLTSSNTRSTSSKDSSALKSALRKSSDPRAQPSKPLGTRHGREPSRRMYIRRDISDDSDDEMLISQVKAPIRRSQKTILQQAISSILPRGSPRVLKASKSPSAPVTRVRQASSSAHALFTRSRATGESADCRQCHRCETYQPRSKTLRCMTCQLAVCTTCLLEHYAGHPSYAATLAYMRSSEQRDPSTDTLDVADIDFKCPVCKYLCRCTGCLRGPFPKTSAVHMPATSQIAEVSAPMRRSESVLSSDADLEPLHWPGLAAGTSSRPNLKVRLRVDRPSSAASRLSKSAQAQARNCTISSAYHDLQDAIASEAARRAQVDAETDFVPVVSSRQPRRTGHGPLSPEQQPSSGSTTLSPSSSDSEAGSILVATSRRPRPTLSARVRFATKVGQQLGKSPAYVESRRSPRREGDQLM